MLECVCTKDWVRSQICAGVDICTDEEVDVYVCECMGKKCICVWKSNTLGEGEHICVCEYICGEMCIQMCLSVLLRWLDVYVCAGVSKE